MSRRRVEGIIISKDHFVGLCIVIAEGGRSSSVMEWEVRKREVARSWRISWKYSLMGIPEALRCWTTLLPGVGVWPVLPLTPEVLVRSLAFG